MEKVPRLCDQWMEGRKIKEEEAGIRKHDCGLMMRASSRQSGVVWEVDQLKVSKDVLSFQVGTASDRVYKRQPVLGSCCGDYLDSHHVAEAVEEILQFGPGGNRIRARIARRWLKKLGFIHGRYAKGDYLMAMNAGMWFTTGMFLPLLR